jgi:hypothetical protein
LLGCVIRKRKFRPEKTAGGKKKRKNLFHAGCPSEASSKALSVER